MSRPILRCNKSIKRSRWESKVGAHVVARSEHVGLREGRLETAGICARSTWTEAGSERSCKARSISFARLQYILSTIVYSFEFVHIPGGRGSHLAEVISQRGHQR